MATWQNIGGTWKSGTWFVRVAGVWRQAQVWQNVQGIWKQLSTVFTPDGGGVDNAGRYTTSQTLSCTTPATWTYTATDCTANLPSGATANNIMFTCVAGGSANNRTTRNGTATVTGTSNGVTRNFTVTLTADGDNI
jgi:hypothetical protein